jgi:Cu(I)/Ag(I) efflux system membrane protein CusA/SilA
LRTDLGYGAAAETGVDMLLYHAWEAIQAQRKADGKSATAADLYSAAMAGALERASV